MAQRSVPQLPPWERRPRGLVSLWDMLKRYAFAIFRLGRDLGQADAWFDDTQADAGDRKLRGINEVWSWVAETGELAGLCADLDLPLSGDAVERLRGMTGVHPTLEVFRPAMMELRNRIEDELKRRVLLPVDFTKVPYFETPLLKWEPVIAAFPSAANDIEEAGRCYALGRYTAAVFHSMRVIELALRALARSLSEPKIDPSRNPNWGTILAFCDRELGKDRPQRIAAWQKSEAFYAEVVAELRAVKDAWRNPTLHVQKDYNEDQALMIIDRTRSLMTVIASGLREWTPDAAVQDAFQNSGSTPNS